MPSTYCFELIKKAEQCEWKDMVYTGDNPKKDFVNLNRLDMQTVRVLAGVQRHKQVSLDYEAQIRVESLVKTSFT